MVFETKKNPGVLENFDHKSIVQNPSDGNSEMNASPLEKHLIHSNLDNWSIDKGTKT